MLKNKQKREKMLEIARLEEDKEDERERQRAQHRVDQAEKLLERRNVASLSPPKKEPEEVEFEDSLNNKTGKNSLKFAQPKSPSDSDKD